ncbi:MAG TPA: AAA family ATPase [Candidatus Limnocylindrales bacterium]|nr:AAA family ATPase [Candidatus Limnocylindrales bacterium]
MRISRLQVRNVRRHADLDLQLAPGLNVVRGPNESGKTTIQRALELALTRRVTSSSGDLDSLRSWKAGEDDRPWVRLEFEQEVEDGVEAGSLEKAFRGSKGTVDLRTDGQTITDPALADQVMAELTGIPSEAFFRSTASVRHHELDGLDRDEAALRDRLQASISGGDRGTSRARRKLERALFLLNTKGDKNPGQIKVAEAALAQSAAALRNGEAALGQLEKDRDALATARDRRVTAEAALVQKRSLLDKARLAERLSTERDVAKQRFERYRAAVDVADEIAKLEAARPSQMELPLLREILGKVRDADARIRELKARLEGEVEVKFEVQEPTPRAWRPTAAIAVVFILVSVALVLADTLTKLPVRLPSVQIQIPGAPIDIPGTPAIAVILLFVGVILAMIGRRQRIRAMDFRKTKDLREAEIERRLRGRSQLENELQMAEVLLQNQLSSISLPDLAAVQDLMDRSEAHENSILRLRAQLEGLVGREPIGTLPQARDAAAAEIEQKSGALEELGPIAREARARERLEVEVADADRTLGIVRDEEAGARARVDQNAIDAEEVATHAEHVATWSEQLAHLQRRARVYDTTLRALEAAERATIRTATRYLERRMVGDLDRVTAGRYRRVKVDDQDLGIRVFAPELGDWVDVSVLSQGTLDLVYLAARIGLVRLVTGDRRPPLVLDDPFVTLDDDRAKRALQLLKEISADFQVIYLTTSSRYDRTADKVSILPGPTALTPDAEPATNGAAEPDAAGPPGAAPAGSASAVGEPPPIGEPVPPPPIDRNAPDPEVAPA